MGRHLIHNLFLLPWQIIHLENAAALGKSVRSAIKILYRFWKQELWRTPLLWRNVVKVPVKVQLKYMTMHQIRQLCRHIVHSLMFPQLAPGMMCQMDRPLVPSLMVSQLLSAPSEDDVPTSTLNGSTPSSQPDVLSAPSEDDVPPNTPNGSAPSSQPDVPSASSGVDLQPKKSNGSATSSQPDVPSAPCGDDVPPNTLNGSAASSRPDVPSAPSVVDVQPNTSNGSAPGSHPDVPSASPEDDVQPLEGRKRKRSESHSPSTPLRRIVPSRTESPPSGGFWSSLGQLLRF
ncbi:hypothetical protein DFS34DRAFT_323733 [Phlyctochytrium arcticum]|nr:hypothetical protein DFS34DRAFT_323733 [Phlyctochytrium arcticum]